MSVHQDSPKILVTGGLGYIGSHTVVELIESGYEVLIVDNLSNSEEKILDQIESIVGKSVQFFDFDICDRELLERFAKMQPDIIGIIHFAAFKSVSESVSLPLKYYQNNLQSLLNLLGAFGKRSINFVFSSSCTVYGEPDEVPVTENSPIKESKTAYGKSKQMSESILKDFASANPHFRVISLRYFNPVGAHASAKIGELPKGVPQNLLPFITQTAIGKREKLTIYGKDYPTKDGTCIRDFIHVCDLAKAHVSAMTRLGNEDNTSPFECYNVGTGRGVSVLELLKCFEETNNITVNHEFGERRAGDVTEIWADVRHVEDKLQWKSTYSLKDIVSSAWAWEQYLSKNNII